MPEFETMFLSDTRANQPAASAADQKFYQVTDEGNIIERSDGATWANWGPSGSGSYRLIQSKVVSGGHFTVKVWAETGRVRCFAIHGGSHGSSGDNDNFIGNGTWTDTATNITNFTFHSANATGIGNGSTFSIYYVVN
jgi:hypothetical protein